MPDIATHTEIAKPIIGGGTSIFTALLFEYLGVTPPIFVAASFGSIVAVLMLGKFKELETSWGIIPPWLVALLVSFTGGISACYGYRLMQPLFKLIQPVVNIQLEQTPTTALLAFIIVYFSAEILSVIKSRIEGFKK